MIPPTEISRFSIFVSNNGFDFSSDDLSIDSTAPFSVTGVEPREVPAHQKATFTISGEKFLNSSNLVCIIYYTSVDTAVNKLHVKAEFVDSTLLRCMYYVAKAGTLRVKLSLGEEDMTDPGFAVRVMDIPNIHLIQPSYGYARLGTVIDIYGAGFMDFNPSCSIGDLVSSAEISNA